MSAPVIKPGPSHSRGMLVVVNTERSFLSLDAPPPIPASAPVRAPTPPRPKPKVGLPATPRRQDNNGQRERGRSTQTTIASTPAVRSRPPPQEGLDPTSSPRAKRSGDDYARKWVLEKKGKRLTQDTMVVAQQLRLLR